MFRNRIQHIHSQDWPSQSQGVCRCSGSFVAVSLGAIGSNEARQSVYQAAFDDARRQIARRNVMATWNWRNN